MPENTEKIMSGKNQKNITLSASAAQEFQLVSDWLGIPQASLIRQKIEEVHQSPAFASVVRRAKAAQKAATQVCRLTEALRAAIDGNDAAVRLLDELESELTALLGEVPKS
jgi:hypothetical protein